MFTGESVDPQAVREALLARIASLQKNGITNEEFDLSCKRLYGLEIRGFNDVDDLAYQMVDAYFKDTTLFGTLEAYQTVTRDDVQRMIDRLRADHCSFSVVKGEAK